MKQKQILYLLAINSDIDLVSLGDSSVVLDLVCEALLNKHYIQPNGFGFDLTSSGKECVYRLLDVI